MKTVKYSLILFLIFSFNYLIFSQVYNFKIGTITEELKVESSATGAVDMGKIIRVKDIPEDISDTSLSKKEEQKQYVATTPNFIGSTRKNTHSTSSILL